MTHDDVLFGYRLRLFTLAEELGNVSEACRRMGVSRSTYYAWKPKLERYGLDGLRVRERRRPRMPNQIGPTSSTASSPRARPPAIRPAADRGRARKAQVGRDEDLRARRVAGPSAL
jgi:transposase-like protein